MNLKNLALWDTVKGYFLFAVVVFGYVSYMMYCESLPPQSGSGAAWHPGEDDYVEGAWR